MKYAFQVINLCLLFTGISAFGFGDVDFDRSNGLDLMAKYLAHYKDPNADKRIKLLRENYERLKPSKVPLSSTPTIPKIIHQVWLKNTPIPQNYKYFLETWRQYHPNWQIKIWTEQDILKENFASKDLYMLARSNAEQIDLASYEIIWRYGGLYIDTDIECYASFEELHYKYDFYTNMEPPALNKKRVTIGTSMIAAAPNHPIFKYTLDNIRKNWQKSEEDFEKNYSNSWSKFSRSLDNLAVLRTMYPYSDGVFSFLESEEQFKYNSIILPAGYNIPMYFVNNMPVLNFLSELFRGKSRLSSQIIVQPETMSLYFADNQNSLIPEYNFANSLFKNNLVKGSIYNLLQSRDKYYLAFKELYNNNFPTDLSYHTEASIPQNIYLDVRSYSKAEAELIKKAWQKINSTFEIISFDSSSLLPAELNPIDEQAKKIILAFYLLNETGGVYLSGSIKPSILKELHYKYNYYGKLSLLDNIFDPINMDMSIMGFSKNHPVISNLLNDIKNEIAKNKDINLQKIKQLYLENAYKYYQLDGDSIILPGIYFQ